MWNLKNDTNELTYKPETDLHTEKDLVLPKRKRNEEGKLRSLGLTDA